MLVTLTGQVVASPTVARPTSRSSRRAQRRHESTEAGLRRHDRVDHWTPDSLDGDQARLAALMKTITDIHPMRDTHPDWAYRCIEQLVQHRGHWYPPRSPAPLPGAWRRTSLLRQCHTTQQGLAPDLRRGLRTGTSWPGLRTCLVCPPGRRGRRPHMAGWRWSRVCRNPVHHQPHRTIRTTARHHGTASVRRPPRRLGTSALRPTRHDGAYVDQPMTTTIGAAETRR